MKKKFRVVAGKNFFCDEKGLLEKDEAGLYREVPEEEVADAEEVAETDDSATEEVAKMLKEARAQVQTDAEKSLGDSQVKALEAVDAMLKGIAEAATSHVTKVSEAGQTKASYDVEAVTKGIAELSDNQRNVFSFEIKTKQDLDFLVKATSESGSLTDDVIEPQRESEITRDPVRQVFIEGISDVTPNMTSDNLSYVEVITETGAPATTAELGTIGEKDFDFQEFKAPLKKIAITNKHSVEILKDAPQLVSAIKAWLAEDVNIVTDQQLLNGDGTGSNLTGVMTVASVLDAAEVGTKTVANANLYDVIRLAITKIAVNGKGKFQATHVLLNPEDADELDLTKDANGQYVLPPFRSADGTQIKGARVIENVGVPTGDFLVGDFRKLHIGTQGGVEVEMTNSDGTDFSKDILTVKLRRRVASYVRTNDNAAFWTGTISTVITELTN